MKVGNVTLLPSFYRDPETMMAPLTSVVCTNTKLTASTSTKIHYRTFRSWLYSQNTYAYTIYGHVLMLTIALSSVSSLHTMLHFMHTFIYFAFIFFPVALVISIFVPYISLFVNSLLQHCHFYLLVAVLTTATG
jgi:hypothetical protein